MITRATSGRIYYIRILTNTKVGFVDVYAHGAHHTDQDPAEEDSPTVGQRYRIPHITQTHTHTPTRPDVVDLIEKFSSSPTAHLCTLQVDA